MKHFPFILLLAALLTAACGKQQEAKPTPAPVATTDDSTLYGLVCDGSNDTILIYLRDPYDGSDPDTLHILEASKRRQVFGTLRIGDKVAIKRDSADCHKAQQVIVTQDLLGQWCYKKKPTLKRKAGMDSTLSIPDSLQKILDTELEYGFTLKIDSAAQPVWPRDFSAANDEASPIDYHRPKRYRQWYIYDGHLLLTETRLDSVGNYIPISTDTTSLVLLTPDSLVLRFSDGEHSYYRKKETTE